MSTQVAIILPVYNRQHHLPEAIQSVMRQTYHDWSLVILDDGSTDSSYQIACSYAAVDCRISAVKMDMHCGNPARPRNIGMQITDSRYIAFLDSDDSWTQEKLARQINFMRGKNSAFSFTAYNIVDETGQLLRVFNNIPSTLDQKGYLGNTCIAPSTVMVERQTMMPYFPETKKTGEDFLAFYELLKKGNATGLNETLTNYRRSKDALSRNVARSAWEQAKTYARISKDVGIGTAGRAYISYAARAFMKRTKATTQTNGEIPSPATRPAPW